MQIREEYIKQLKRLIKKYHPDHCKDENLEKMYYDITVSLTNKLSRIRTKKNTSVKIDNQDYNYYKLGIKYYKNIHPDKFYKKIIKNTFETKTYEEQLKILNLIFFSFNSAEYYFTKVVMEYPKSEWADDAKEKINLLNKLFKSYDNIDVEENNQIIDSSKFVNEMGIKIM
jgi:outer membrane protein assembly factor BamD (BamD/ComL family)